MLLKTTEVPLGLIVVVGDYWRWSWVDFETWSRGVEYGETWSRVVEYGKTWSRVVEYRRKLS